MKKQYDCKVDGLIKNGPYWGICGKKIIGNKKCGAHGNKKCEHKIARPNNDK